MKKQTITSFRFNKVELVCNFDNSFQMIGRSTAALKKI